MSLFVASELKAKHKNKYRNKFENYSYSFESLNENLSSYDVFLSHSYNDKELIYSIRQELVDYGLTVYVDWIDDEQLERNRVTRETAKKLKQRMENAKALIFVTTDNSGDSKWMPWELGYFDGYKSKVAILPVIQKHGDEYTGQEYLGIYDYITKEGHKLLVNDPTQKPGEKLFQMFPGTEIRRWINGNNLTDY